jgi:integrase
MSRGTITERKPGVFQIKWDAGPDPKTGERRQRYATVKGLKRDAQRELRRRLDTVDSGKHVDRSVKTVGEWLSEWLAAHSGNIGAKTAERYGDMIRLYLAPRLGHIALQKLDAPTVQRAFNELRDSGRLRKSIKGPGLSPKMQLGLRTLLKLALQDAVRYKLLQESPISDRGSVKIQKPAKAKLRTLNRTELGRLLRELRDAPAHRLGWLYPIVRLAVATGLRPGELLALRWQDVDLEARRLSVVRTITETRERVTFKGQAKTESSLRTIPLSETTAEYLRGHRAQQRDVGKAFNSAMKKRAFNVDFYGLRHTFATLALQAGVSVKTVSVLLGHRSVKITLDHYAQVLDEMQIDAAVKIDEFLEGTL